MKNITASGSFDDMRFNDLAFLKAASKLGRLTIILWSDEMHEKIYGRKPKFSLRERKYFIEALKYVDKAICISGVFDADKLPPNTKTDIWTVLPTENNDAKKAFCSAEGISCSVVKPDAGTDGKYARLALESDEKKVIVTGCYDYFHTGHIRFFEEVSEHGELYVVIGSDKNVELLKGSGHPHYTEDERLFMVRSIKYVKNAYVSTGSGWMDAEPEIEVIKPDIYAVNEDGDKPEKREFCEKHGLQYLILKRTPREGLPARSSTELRGF